MSEDERPLIVTLGLDPASFARLDALRRAHFPPERNWLPAHLTLFHHLPGAEAAQVAADLRDAAARAPIPLRVDAPMLLGRGVAFRVHAPELVALRAALAERWAAWLTSQDSRPLRPHVTVQNKVEPAAAKALHGELSAGFEPWPATGEALLLWRYLGGPWEALDTFPLSRAAGDPRVEPGVTSSSDLIRGCQARNATD